MSGRRAALAILAASLLAGCVSQRVTPQAEEQQAIAAAEQDVQTIALSRESGSVICRYEAPTGTRLKRRVCITKTELRQVSADAQEWLRSGGARGRVTKVSR